ncbi:unnamed protein product [Prunus armeniaca]
MNCKIIGAFFKSTEMYFHEAIKSMSLCEVGSTKVSTNRFHDGFDQSYRFIREVQYPTWFPSIVLVKKKNGQIRICIDFRDLNNACPKDEFPLPITELLVDATTGFGALSFMDGFSRYNQIKMAPEDEELTAFRTQKRFIVIL